MSKAFGIIFGRNNSFENKFVVAGGRGEKKQLIKQLEAEGWVVKNINRLRPKPGDRFPLPGKIVTIGLK